MNNTLKNAARKLYKENNITSGYEHFEIAFDNGVLDYIRDDYCLPRNADEKFAYMEGVKFAEKNDYSVWDLY